MKTIHRILSVSLVPLLLTVLSSSSAAAIETNTKAPIFTLTNSEDKPVSLSDYSGKIVYLDFWASWCGPCRHTLPWMNELQHKFPSEKFAVLTVNIDKDSSKVKQVIADQKLTFNVLLDPEGNVPKQFQLPTMPTSFLINRKGEVAKIHPGFRDGDQTDIESSIQQLLEKE